MIWWNRCTCSRSGVTRSGGLPPGKNDQGVRLMPTLDLSVDEGLLDHGDHHLQALAFGHQAQVLRPYADHHVAGASLRAGSNACLGRRTDVAPNSTVSSRTKRGEQVHCTRADEARAEQVGGPVAQCHRLDPVVRDVHRGEADSPLQPGDLGSGGDVQRGVEVRERPVVRRGVRAGERPSRRSAGPPCRPMRWGTGRAGGPSVRSPHRG